MPRSILVQVGARPYRVLIDSIESWRSAPPEELEAFRERRAVLVTDRHVAAHWLPAGLSLLEGMGLHPSVVELPPGESTKQMSSLTQLYDAFLAAGLRRDGLVIALGGGVIGDLAGCAAATWMRGVSFLQVPTTLLAMADASVGGKVGIDYGGAKNLIGAFHQPVLVLAAPETLSTLPDEELANGLAEVVKAAMIADGELYHLLETRDVPIWRREPVVLEKLLQRSIQVKARIVTADEREQGERRKLNLGHTIGHALEAATGFKTYRHGEAVAIGLIAACRLSQMLGLCGASVLESVERLLERHRLPIRASGLEWERIEPWLHLDKKAGEEGWTFVLTAGIGDVTVRPRVPEGLVREATEYVLA
ncbi:MAG: 3-dehydroquinate synthase [Candidatus Eisenbacteria bacterium]|nr:3-dehydroquinate synthase [Candidatus Eisenbacteria bacterium]